MKFVLITLDADIRAAAVEGFHPSDELQVFENWRDALPACREADLVFVDLLATLTTPGKIAGYEEFALAKMASPIAAPIPLVLIAPPEDYDLDFMVGWEDFVFAHVRRPVTYKIFRRASTWV